MTRRPRKPSATIERKIYFYRVDAGTRSDGEPILFDPLPTLQKIAKLKFNDDDNSCYLIDPDGNATCVIPEFNRNKPALKFCQVRRNGLPQVEHAGAISELNIAPDAGLLEPVHVVFLTENIVGADFNFYGPRLSRLGFYFKVKDKSITHLQFVPLLRQDVTMQLNKLENISLFDLKIKAAFAKTLENNDDSLQQAIKAQTRILDGDTKDIQIVLRPRRNSRRSALNRLRDKIRELISMEDFIENAERLQVKGILNDTGKIDTIDLLKDQLIAKKQILRYKERSRAVKAESAYEAIESSYLELRDSLHLAAGIEL